MIHDNQTNQVYISGKLQDQEFYPGFYAEFTRKLKQKNIGYVVIPEEWTNDIWVRDFLPVQIFWEEMVWFKYKPDYLEKLEHLRTDQEPLFKKMELNPVDASDYILDGGNIVRGETKAIVTQKAFDDNEDLTVEKLRSVLKVEELIVIPREPWDETGHADGMVRFLDDQTVLVAEHNIHKDHTPNIAEKLYGALGGVGLNIFQVPNKIFDKMDYREPGVDKKFTAHTAVGNYINYAQVGETVFVPQYARGMEYSHQYADARELDAQALECFRSIFGCNNAVPVNAYHIAIRGGSLNCITWNIAV